MKKIIWFSPILALALAFALTGKAQAANGAFGRSIDEGYFTGINRFSGGSGSGPQVLGADGTYAWPVGGGDPINFNAENFITLMRNYLLNGGGDQTNGKDTTSSGVIIDAMLGVRGDSFGCPPSPPVNGCRDNGVIYAQTHFDEWANRVRDYANNIGGRSVGWTDTVTFCPGDLNTLSTVPYPGYSNNTRPGDVAFYAETRGCYAEYTVVFHNPDGTSFSLKRNCGNIVGNSYSLFPTPPPVTDNAPPGGVLENVDCNFLTGWALDGDNINASIRVIITIDSDPYYLANTDVYRPEINAAFNAQGIPVTGNHGFNWAVPAKYRNGQVHNVTVFANDIDSNGNPNNNNQPLQNGINRKFGPCPASRIQGYKVIGSGSSVINPGNNQPGNADVVYICCNLNPNPNNPANPNPQTNNPYGFNNLQREPHRVAVKEPPGWVAIGYTVCYDRIDCHTGPLQGLQPNPDCIPGPAPNCGPYKNWPSAVVDTKGHEYADLYFHFAPEPPKVTAKCEAGVSSADITWNKLGASSFFVDVDDKKDSTFGSFWNKGVSPPFLGSTVSTTAPAGFNAFNGKTPSPMVMKNGADYSTRVYYKFNAYNVHSAPVNFKTPVCWGFDVTPTANASGNPDDENPSSVTFGSGFTITFTPSSTSGLSGIQLKTTRTFYIQRNGGPLGPWGSPIVENKLFPVGGANYLDTNTIPTPPPLGAGDKFCVKFAVEPGAGTVDPNGSTRLITSAKKETSLECLTIANKPYFRVYGGDVLAGSQGFKSSAGSCSAAPIASQILGYNRGTGVGAGTQLAAQAMAKIKGFSSATGRTAIPNPPSGLSFANFGVPGISALPDGIYGGDFGDSRCNKNYFAAATSPPAAGNKTIIATTILPGTPNAIYVDGDATITGNITYATAGWNAGNIPSFYLVVKGNINIAASVGQLDGVYIAQPRDDNNDGIPDPNTGRINTCWDPGTGSIPVLISLFDFCKTQPLKVNGAFIAQRVNLLRTINSLRNSASNESAPGNAAEIFQFGPESWLGASASPTPPSSSTVYDSITSLPPVL